MTHRNPVAASIAVRPLLLGPRRPARVLGAFPSAAYVGLEASLRADGPSVVALVTARAVRLPNALVMGGTAPWTVALRVGGAAPWTPTLAGRAEIGDGEVRVGALVLHVTRWWTPRRPTTAQQTGATVLPGRVAQLRTELARHGSALPVPAAQALYALTEACHALDPAGAFAAADRLIGLGPGLTPAGDDALAGFLLAATHLSPTSQDPLLTALADHVRVQASVRTTALSATLLHHAARGEAAPEAIAVLDALCGHGGLRQATDSLLRIGHSSGGDLAHGLLAGARVAIPLRAAA